MFQSLDVFQTAYDMARHAGQRQAVTARNIANADTPGYRAQTMDSFAEAYRGHETTTLRSTRAGHIGGADAGAAAARARMADAEPSPNGNSVSLEEEMLRGVEIQREHNRALAIYKHGLDVLRMSIGRR
ncbi:FlgB family protein [Octadecabacter sp. R77987]|uniref:FlgB family protein n=1 Tax=Octadecabacter sp. R77987 TaxID=3093874 RepID=UPI00367308BA